MKFSEEFEHFAMIHRQIPSNETIVFHHHKITVSTDFDSEIILIILNNILVFGFKILLLNTSRRQNLNRISKF